VPAVNASAVRKQIAAGETSPIYLLLGADDLEKSAMANEFAGLVEQGLEAFNIERVYGADTSVDSVIDSAQTLPMMAPRRVIIVLQAEKLLIPKRESKASEAEQERLEAFLQNPPSHSTLVFVCGPLDSRRRVVKLLLKEAAIVDCGTIADDADAERWVKARAARDKLPLDAGAVRALVQCAGPDLVRLRSGIERLALYALGQPEITAEDVKAAVQAAPDAQADFGVAKAIWRNDAKVALRELALAMDAGTIPVMMMGQLRAAAEKLPAGRIRVAMDAVLRTDLALKSSGGDPRVLLERLVVELCGAGDGSRSGPPAYRR
jgi:DNA polymerase-3 subunit delta